jgi:hypothetical protein
VNRPLHPQVEPLAREYARELGEVFPSKDLDARIDRLVAAHGKEISGPRAARPRAAPIHVPRWAAAAALALVAIAAGVLIGVTVERGASEHVTVLATPRSMGSDAEAAWPPAGMAMWPTDSVALKVPAIYAADGTLVAVDDVARQTSARYWVDIVVSNDGTVRIQNVVPAGTVNPTGKQEHAPKRQTP